MKTCARCEETKPLSDFRKSKKGRYGFDEYCKVCNSNRQLKPWGTPEKPKPAPPVLREEFRQFLFFLTLDYNKQRVYQEAKQGLSVIERNILIQITRRGENDWKEAA